MENISSLFENLSVKYKNQGIKETRRDRIYGFIVLVSGTFALLFTQYHFGWLDNTWATIGVCVMFISGLWCLRHLSQFACVEMPNEITEEFIALINQHVPKSDLIEIEFESSSLCYYRFSPSGKYEEAVTIVFHDRSYIQGEFWITTKEIIMSPENRSDKFYKL